MQKKRKKTVVRLKKKTRRPQPKKGGLEMTMAAIGAGIIWYALLTGAPQKEQRAEAQQRRVERVQLRTAEERRRDSAEETKPVVLVAIKDQPRVKPKQAAAEKGCNNPGNLRGKGGAFRCFRTKREGYEALRADLTAKASGQSRAMAARLGEGYRPTIYNIVSVYAPPSENDTERYARRVSEWSGIPAHRRLTAADVGRIIHPVIRMEHGQEKAEQYMRYASN